MSQSATPAARNPVARRLKPPKVITFSALPICTAIASSSTVANGCQRLPTVTNGCGHKSSVERTHLNPQTPKVKRKPFATHSRKTTNHFGQHRPSYLETEVIVCSKYIYIHIQGHELRKCKKKNQKKYRSDSIANVHRTRPTRLPVCHGFLDCFHCLLTKPMQFVKFQGNLDWTLTIPISCTVGLLRSTHDS